MTALSDETEGVRGDDLVGEAARIWLVNGLIQLVQKWRDVTGGRGCGRLTNCEQR
jgi:hypothetical protein